MVPLGGQCNDLERLHVYYHIPSVTAPSQGLFLVHAVQLHPLVCSRASWGLFARWSLGHMSFRFSEIKGCHVLPHVCFFKNKNLQKSEEPKVHC